MEINYEVTLSNKNNCSFFLFHLRMLATWVWTEYARRQIFSPDKNKSATFLITFKVRLKSLATLGRLFGDFCWQLRSQVGGESVHNGNFILFPTVLSWAGYYNAFGVFSPKIKTLSQQYFLKLKESATNSNYAWRWLPCQKVQINEQLREVSPNSKIQAML